MGDIKSEIEFKPIVFSKGELVKTPKGNEIELVFEENEVSKDCKDIDLLKETSSQFFSRGFDYLSDTLGENYSYLSKKMAINFIDSENARHAGILSLVSVPWLRKYIENPKNDYWKDFLQSVYIHEILHNIMVEEELPMLGELLYVREKGQKDRIEEVHGLLNNGKLDHSHRKGLGVISSWLGYKNGSDVLENLPSYDLGSLKDIFREKMDEYCKERLPKKVD